ncbi:DUF5518 domain-containing protein [Halorarum salinum]|uniref:DUF5518 domain-containing protein n=1 Tax=Halorarum salinum TaxID=2743089 RepID=A0A7D5LC09_9EURY|nr:DUF5518 domain-containing protein [Halobaculum salinum]QLG63152.1 DUF5518 domain-containing protein [Halobaculum salinum]
MSINWRAVGIGFVVTLVVGLVVGFSIPIADVTLSGVGWAITGIIGGGAAGYVVGRGVNGGATHGVVAAALGALAVLVVLDGAGTVLEGVPLVPLLLVGLYAVAGALGGAVGVMLNRTSGGADETEARRPAGR